MRDEFISELLKEVLGPRDGSEETLLEDPYDEYLTGVIVPWKWHGKDVEADDAEPVAGGGVSEDDPSDAYIVSAFSSALDPLSKPGSMGISFRLGGADPSMDLCVTWGRYQHLKDTEDGGWKRVSNRAIIGVKLDEVGDRTYKPYSVYSEDDGEIYLAIRKDVVGEYTSVTVKLINDLQPEGKNKPHTSCCIFQPSIRIKLADGTFAAPEKKEYSESEEDMTLQFLYRERLSLARGHMCAAFWRDVDPEESGVDFPSLWVDGVTHKDCHEFVAPDFRTEFVPVYAMPSPDFEWQSEYGAAPDLSAAKLSEIWNDDEIDEHLLPMYESYLKWAEKNNEITDSFSDDELRAARKIVDFQKKACERILSGINLIKKDKNVRLSFCFANRVIWLQNHWKKKTDDFGWRPFQLAFFLMNIEPLFNENSEYRNVADLLWIPTGGGKTEAYLAIMAFTMALRRRKALTSSTSSVNMTGGGTAVISRYTLRLLTVQQFRRTIQMVTAAEYLRVQTVHEKIGWRPEKCDITDDFILGSMRFSAGLWVGIGVTPNKLRGDRGAIKALRGGAKDAGEPAQLTTCPVCGGWLSIPNEGITERKLTIHMVFKTDADVDSVEQFFRTLEVKDDMVEVEGIKVTAESHSAGYMTASFSMSCQRDDLKPENVEKLWGDVSGKADENGITLKIASFRASRPGYFPVIEPTSRKPPREGDFEIYCPNPECNLNREVHWKEGVPLNIDPEDREELSDGLYLKKVETPFVEGARIPIPACIVDEQVYRRCPTVIVGTADKIARLAFEPRVASMFGNVEKYSSCYGYYRDDLLPKDPNATTKRCKEERMTTSVPPFSPPDLIVQDELHLIDGPLGSMFGLYETAVGALCSSDERVPRYIASTATIKHAESQIQSLFTRDMFQFPPHGMEIEDSFFVHYPSGEQAWDETHPGRVYMGICAPGRGAHTPLIRIWSRILKTGNDVKHKKHAGNFWTLVGYFNAIRELGGALALYRQDIVERLEHLRKISGGQIREIDQSRIVELSSRIESTHLPSILKELETLKTPVEKNPDAIFATSMFGTGVDIPHLSLMAVQGQPKTTSAYIQATGRVGRKYSAPVITFLRASRPRDMSHYEMFTRYHHRIYLDVEPVSVSPFSDGALRRAAGPVAVAFLRNMRDAHVRWWGDSGDVVIDADSELDVQQINDLFENRFSKLPESVVKQGKTSQEIREDIKSQIEWWKTIAEQSGTSLRFNEYTMYGPPEKDVVLGDPAHKHAGKKFVYENAPQSLRDVEETTGFEVGRPEKVQHIRRSQFVTTYGPGAIIEGRQGPRVILTIDGGLGRRFNNETLEKFEILDMRMAKLVANARIFALPTKESEKVPQNYSIYRTKEFPVWRICTDTKKHKTSVLYNGENKGGKCPECGNVGEPVRFILACPDGHMDDIPWNPAVHGKEHGIKCCGWFYWRGGGSSVRSIEIECPTCHKKTTMGAIYARGWMCTGRFPEQVYPASPQGGQGKCSSTMKIIQRQATNLRIPEILTLLTIPKYDTPIVKVIQERGVYEIFRVLEDMEELDEEHFRKLINKKIESSTVLKESGELIDKYISDNGWEQFLKLYRDLLPKDGEYRDMLRDMLIEEFRSLQNASEDGYPRKGNGNFSMEKSKNISVDLPPGRGRLTFRVAGIDVLRTVTVQKGYTRMPYMKSEGKPNRMISVAAKEHDSEEKWLPGVESLGEGIFITSSENPLNPSIPAVNEWDATKTNSMDEDNRNRDPLFVWWHTLSHALIRTLSLYSGYSSSALRERVYLDDSEGQKQCGILIYTVMSGEDGGMGGLTGTVAGFGDILTNAIKSISLCSNDPLCIEQRITEKNCNGAACHSCLLISETSCEHRNMWLDRHLILGDNEFS